MLIIVKSLDWEDLSAPAVDRIVNTDHIASAVVKRKTLDSGVIEFTEVFLDTGPAFAVAMTLAQLRDAQRM